MNVLFVVVPFYGLLRMLPLVVETIFKRGIDNVTFGLCRKRKKISFTFILSHIVESETQPCQNS